MLNYSINSRLAIALLLTLMWTAATLTNADDNNKCNLQRASEKEKEMLKFLDKLAGKRYKFIDPDKNHTYYFSVCDKAEMAVNDDEGFIQQNVQTNKTVVIGRLKNVDLEGGGFIRMTYNDGEKYPNACNRTLRAAVVYFKCPDDKKEEKLTMIEENNVRDDDCNYLFVLWTPIMCVSLNPTTTPAIITTSTSTSTTASTSSSSSTPSSSSSTTNDSTSTSSTTTKSDEHKNDNNGKSHFGVLSLILIALFSLAVVYMAVGTLYLRFVRKARGVEQIPNWPFWEAIGGKSADFCNYICRCGNRQTEIHTYENINDRISDDENLLNM